MKKLPKLSISRILRTSAMFAPPSTQPDIMAGVSSSPTKVLLPELLVKIFMLCLDIETIDMVPILRGSLVFGQVCRHWRSVALSTPLLWTALPLLLATPWLNKKKNIVFLEEYLKRSEPLPFSFYLKESERSRKTGILPLLSVLIKHSHRWKDVALTIVRLKEFELMESVSGKFLALEHLSMSLSLGPLSAMENKMEDKWVLSCLTGLILRDCSPNGDVFNDILPRLSAPSLQELRLIGYRLHPQLVSNVQRLVVQSKCNLLKLTVRGHMGSFHNPGELAKFLTHTPALQELWISHIEAADLMRLCLHPDQTHEPLVPSLTVLDLQAVVDKLIDVGLVSKLAYSRCEFTKRQIDGSITSLDNRGCCPLQLFSYRPYANSRLLNHYEILEGLAIEEPDPRLFLNAPWAWSALPLLGGRNIVKINSPDAATIDNFFTQLEAYEIPGPGFFQSSRIHLHLHDIARGLFQIETQDPEQNFPQRAAQILDKWKPFLMECLPQRRWIVYDGSFIIFVHPETSIRESDDALSLIFGMESDSYKQSLDMRLSKLRSS